MAYGSYIAPGQKAINFFRERLEREKQEGNELVAISVWRGAAFVAWRQARPSPSASSQSAWLLPQYACAVGREAASAQRSCLPTTIVVGWLGERRAGKQQREPSIPTQR